VNTVMTLSKGENIVKWIKGQNKLAGSHGENGGG
jgi:hypothetical protein